MEFDKKLRMKAFILTKLGPVFHSQITQSHGSINQKILLSLFNKLYTKAQESFVTFFLLKTKGVYEKSGNKVIFLDIIFQHFLE